jgi:hypothetical protein
MSTYGPEYEGRTAISKDGKSRIVIRNGEAVADTTYQPQAAASRATTTPDDRKALVAAQGKASAERDAVRQYLGASRAVSNMGPGPVKAAWMDTITPVEGERGGRTLADLAAGVVGTIATPIGAALRHLQDGRTWQARDQLNTVAANAALSRTSQLKGAASDKDMAMIRMAGVSPYKTEGENRRIINDAIYQSKLEGLRAQLTSQWIGNNGSLTAKSPEGETFEGYLTRGERRYGERFAELQADRKRGLPKPPPSRRTTDGMVTIDMDGNIIR